jgi:hypothetical protein
MCPMIFIGWPMQQTQCNITAKEFFAVPLEAALNRFRETADAGNGGNAQG